LRNRDRQAWPRSLAIALLLLGLAVRPVAAERRIAVLDVSGPKGDGFTKVVLGLVKAENEPITSRRYERAAKKAKARGLGAAAVAKTLDRLNAHGVVIGKVRRRSGGRYELTLTVRSAPDGDVVGQPIAVTIRGTKLKGRALATLRDELEAAIAELPGGDGTTPAKPPKPAQPPKPAPEEETFTIEETEAEPKPPVDVDGELPDKPTPETPPAGDGDGGDDGDGDDDDAPVTITAAEQADLEARGRALEATAGLSMLSRKLTFALNTAVDDEPQGYQGGMVPAIFVAAEAYPLAFQARGRQIVRNLGLTLDYERVLKIESKLETMDMVVLPTVQQRWGVGLVYRWNFGRTPRGPTLKLHLGYGNASFKLDASNAPSDVVIDLPNVAYGYVTPGAELRYPILANLAATVEARYLHISSIGGLGKRSAYGRGTSAGFDAQIGAEYAITRQISAQAAFRYSSFKTTFDGTGDQTDRDGDNTADVDSSADRWLALYLLVGYRL
jgi:hypothetical protein